jgi:shikimate 5-dehydrogenase
MVYGPHQPALAELAAASGTPYVDGRTVLAHQGFAQFAAFTGELPPKEAMLEAIGNSGSSTLKVEG